MDSATAASPPDDTDAHRRVMGVLADCPAEALAARAAALGDLPGWRFLRAPEIGLVMVRGRIGGAGEPFNFGEATVTRAVVVLETGETGHAHALGRDRTKAQLSALVHALWQCDNWRDRIEAEIIAPLAAERTGRDRQRREETAATKVDFFTLERGDP